MEWILWFAIKGNEAAQPIAVFESVKQCERSKKVLSNQIDKAIFECWEQPRGTYKENYGKG